MKRDFLTGRIVKPQRIEEATWPSAVPDDVARAHAAECAALEVKWKAELAARMDADRRYAELSAAFKKLVRRWRDEMSELLSKEP